ncbi:transposase [Flavobacterium sp.]|uniref:transposase n=1 Tax=Flavobacterium sp. TaxID=239 RepID=UPI0035AE7563
MLRLSIVMKKYNNKYRIESVRLKNWDYRNNGAYFITINTGNRKHFFGEIINSEMQLSPIGEYAQNFWMEIPKHFSFVELGNFVVMPNHTHGILIINNVKSLHCYDMDKSLHCNDSTGNQYFSDISPKSGSISTIVRSYKSVVSKHARLLNPEFNWQPKFHDHIIRNSESFERIQNYIENNPSNWKEDKFYST